MRPFSALTALLTGLALAAAGPAGAQAAEEDSLDRDYSGELPRIAPLEPGDALESFEVFPGFRMELVAAEPLVHDPVAMAFDENGRCYVVEMRGYSEQRDDNIGAIRLLEDTDNDGRFDKSSVFIDGLPWPTAVACYDGGIFIGVAPDLLYCKDTDGDGVADVTETVYTGFHLTNVQGLLNSFNWGLDNRLHGATSSSGADLVAGDNPSALPLVLRGRDFAFDPRTRELAATSGGAQHGMHFDAWGRKFVCSNSDHIQLVMFDDHYVARNPYFAAPGPRVSIAVDGPAADVFRISPVEPWRILRTRLRVQGLVPGPVEGGGTAAGYFTSATGVTIYTGNAWPEAMVGQAFIGDVGGNLIHRKGLRPDGPGLTAHRLDENTEFVRSTDIWFRPVQFANAPDGTLYVLDMYREVIEHPDSLPPIIKQHLDLTSGFDRGRLYRIVPDDFQQPAPPRLGGATTAELVALLDHANGWHRETAARLLYERQDASAAAGLEALTASATLPEGRIRALYALDGLGALTPGTVLAALDDAEPFVRVHALRLAEPFAPDHAGVQQALLDAVADADVRVRYQAAFSLGAFATPERHAALAQLIRDDPDDRWFRVAVMSSLYQGAAAVFNGLAADAPFRATESGRRWLADVAVQAGATSNESEIAAVLARVDALPSAETGLAEAAVRNLIEGMKRGDQGGAVSEALAASETAAALLESMLASALATGADAEQPEAARVDAARTLALGEYETAGPVLADLLDAREPAAVQTAALASLSKFRNPEVAAILIEKWPALSPALRGQTTEALFSRTPWTATLVDALENGAFKPSYLDSTRIHALRNHPDEAIRGRAVAALKNYQPGNRADVVAAYRDVLSMEGDPARGHAVFRENCAQCHKLGGEGYEVGPDLSTVAQGGAEKILVNVLDPNSEVNPQYLNYTVETADWQTHSGIIASETATSITLKRPNGVTDTILRVNIESIRSDNLSIMPEGWEESLSKQDLADVITYLTSLE